MLRWLSRLVCGGREQEPDYAALLSADALFLVERRSLSRRFERRSMNLGGRVRLEDLGELPPEIVYYMQALKRSGKQVYVRIEHQTPGECPEQWCCRYYDGHGLLRVWPPVHR